MSLANGFSTAQLARDAAEKELKKRNTLAEWRVADRPEEKKNTYQHLSTLIQIHQSTEDRDDPSEYACPFHSATKLAAYPQV